MAGWNVCYDFMMDNEDAARAYATVQDCGGQAISGIDSASFPLQFDKIAAIEPPSERAAEVESFYKAAFWNPYLAQVADDEVAKRVLDASVNMGEGTAVKLLQQAVNSFHVGNPLTVDGGWGPNTLTAVNAVNPATLVAAFKNARCEHYEAIVAANPAKAQYLPAWLARAAK